MTDKISGSCLCGKVRSTVTGEFQRFYQCYCDRCQKKTGSAFASLMFTAPDNIEWHSGQEYIKRFDLPNAVRFSNCFCTECGSQVPYLSRDGAFLVVPAGYMEGEPNIRPSANIFWDERPCWFDEGKIAPTFKTYPE
ncbi:GFA family protein [Thalassotalea atypica]|uniref:GFA family protein n=1 Tax=Thalassotalea atypica TaxID=2054316 RepID=UPI0025743348|nr:GFA family protein [Thalassotalea atypica]